ncbi:MAG: hypothetical protein VX589_15270 [Myxococcota bacterium]|nr:hypothetical protein [Myxococcota bacterium]
MKSHRLKNLLQTAERHTRRGRLGRAVTFYRKVLATASLGDAEWELAHLRLGDLHIGLQQFEYAIVHLLRARRLAPAEPEYAYLLGRAFRLSGRLTAARQHLFDALFDYRWKADVYYEMALCYPDPQSRGLGLKLCRLALAYDPARPDLLELYRRLADA